MDAFYKNSEVNLIYTSPENPMQWCDDWSVQNCKIICKRLKKLSKKSGTYQLDKTESFYFTDDNICIKSFDKHLCQVLRSQMGYKLWSIHFPAKLMKLMVDDDKYLRIRIKESGGDCKKYNKAMK